VKRWIRFKFGRKQLWINAEEIVAFVEEKPGEPRVKICLPGVPDGFVVDETLDKVGRKVTSWSGFASADLQEYRYEEKL